ncbi:MAG: chemotaxis protein CheA, partial [Deltaproteobacteria bacterium]
DQLEENDGTFDQSCNETAVKITSSLNSILQEAGNKAEAGDDTKDELQVHDEKKGEVDSDLKEIIALVPEDIKNKILEKDGLVFITYTPEPECFYKGDDPFLMIRTVPKVVWGSVFQTEYPDISKEDIDIYRCAIGFNAISLASLEEVDEHLQYVSDQIKTEHFSAELLETPKKQSVTASDEVFEILDAQKEVLEFASGESLDGKVNAALNVVSNIVMLFERKDLIAEIDKMKEQALSNKDPASLFSFVDYIIDELKENKEDEADIPAVEEEKGHDEVISEQKQEISAQKEDKPDIEEPIEEIKKAKEKDAKAEVSAQNEPVLNHEARPKIKLLKVDTDKVDRLMNLVAELVVAKNSLLYLSKKAEEMYEVREFSQEIKDKYSSFDRIIEEMQDAVSEIRMMPVSVIFQRFPRLVRDISKKLGRKVNLRLVGEETEADKNVIEALSEPLIHLVRNSLDHGIEAPEERRQKGKPEVGNLTISAYQEADQVIIEVADDGRGIDPEAVKLKAYKKGLIDEERLEKIDDQKALDLIFLPGFSTAESISEVSGRGVGMDVVKSTLERLNGGVSIETELGKGTKVKLHLPLSMAVTKVMIIESAEQTFGIPMDIVVESVRVPKGSIKKIKHQDAAVLRGKIIPLYSLNSILGIPYEQISNEDNEIAVLVLSIGRSRVGLVVDTFKGTMDVILKPFQGVLASMSCYAGSAILGDGSVLIVLNPKEFWHVS